MTSEGSVAAVFVVTRSPPLNGRSRAQWRVNSGSAEAGVDFVDASGTIEFLAGQTQRAIYVPLYNDTIKEGDETFTLELSSPTGARLGEYTSVVATIRDDD